MSNQRKIIKTVSLTLVSVLCAFVLTIGAYVLYVVLSYKRIADNTAVEVSSSIETILDAGSTYKISTFNIGFGAYNHEFSFFMDSGTMKDGKQVSGINAKASSKDVVINNTNGAINSSIAFGADFMFFQEVDTKSTRSHKVNQLDMIRDSFTDYSYMFANNYDSAYLFYPFNDPIGKSKSGIATFSKYKTTEAMRRSLPLAKSFSKFFDLDRCIMLSRHSINNDKELVLINVHLSAYDSGGLIRQKQLEMLNDILKTERDKGNYVIAGGDFNHDIANSLELFESDQLKPEWVYVLEKEDLAEGYDFAAATNAPTCRSTDLPYEKGVNYSVVIDGFIVSDNINVCSVTNIDLDFENSDHNPVLLEFGMA